MGKKEKTIKKDEKKILENNEVNNISEVVLSGKTNVNANLVGNNVIDGSVANCAESGTGISSECVTTDAKLWVAKEDIIETLIQTKPTLKSITLFDLLTLEKAASLICRRYENTVKMYDGSINRNSCEYNSFKTYLDIHTNVLNEIEKRILEFK